MKKRALLIVLTAAALTVAPVPAFAEEAADPQQPDEHHRHRFRGVIGEVAEYIRKFKSMFKSPGITGYFLGF